MIDTDSVELRFTSCTMMVYYEIMVNGCLDFNLLRTACKKKLRDHQRHSFDFEQVLFQLMLTLLRYLRTKNEDGWKDRQTAFQLYIVDDVKMVIVALCF